MATTEGYIKYAEQYYRDFPVDWIACTLKSYNKNMAGMHKENGYNYKIQQNHLFESVNNNYSC
jgi:hypothetical protein